MSYEVKHTYEVGEDAWIYIGNHKGKVTKGKVVYKFSLDGWAVPEHYVVQIDTPIESVLFVREAPTISQDGGPIGLWRRQ